MGVTQLGSVYAWGNRKYAGQTKHVEIPDILPKLENEKITDLTICYKKVIFKNKNGDMKVWGNYLKDQI